RDALQEGVATALELKSLLTARPSELIADEVIIAGPELIKISDGPSDADVADFVEAMRSAIASEVSRHLSERVENGELAAKKSDELYEATVPAAGHDILPEERAFAEAALKHARTNEVRPASAHVELWVPTTKPVSILSHSFFGTESFGQM